MIKVERWGKWGRCPIWEMRTGKYSKKMKTREVTEKLHDLQDRATETAKHVGEATDSYVRENVWTTVAFAAVLGCIFGFLMGSRRD